MCGPRSTSSIEAHASCGYNKNNTASSVQYTDDTLLNFTRCACVPSWRHGVGVHPPSRRPRRPTVAVCDRPRCALPALEVVYFKWHSSSCVSNYVALCYQPNAVRPTVVSCILCRSVVFVVAPLYSSFVLGTVVTCALCAYSAWRPLSSRTHNQRCAMPGILGDMPADAAH